MARQSRRTSSPTPRRSGVTLDRAARLCRLIHILGQGPQTRLGLLRRLGVDMRAFYRDLDTLREAGISVELDGRHYHLINSVKDSLPLIPFPDPLLTLGEVVTLARGRSRAHQVLKQRLRELLGENLRFVT